MAHAIPALLTKLSTASSVDVQFSYDKLFYWLCVIVVDKMDAILTDMQLDARINKRILMNVIVPKLEYAGEVWEGNAKLVKQLATLQMTAAKNTKVLLRGP